MDGQWGQQICNLESSKLHDFNCNFSRTSPLNHDDLYFTKSHDTKQSSTGKYKRKIYSFLTKNWATDVGINSYNTP